MLVQRDMIPPRCNPSVFSTPKNSKKWVKWNMNYVPLHTIVSNLLRADVSKTNYWLGIRTSSLFAFPHSHFIALNSSVLFFSNRIVTFSGNIRNSIISLNTLLTCTCRTCRIHECYQRTTKWEKSTLICNTEKKVLFQTGTMHKIDNSQFKTGARMTWCCLLQQKHIHCMAYLL